MNNRFKFRAWHKERKKMFDVTSIDFKKQEAVLSYSHNFGDGHLFECNDFLASFNQIELLQFTGFYDSTKWKDLTQEEKERFAVSIGLEDSFDGVQEASKQWKGKEIYEGDILSGTWEQETYFGDYIHEFEKGVVIYNSEYALFSIPSTYGFYIKNPIENCLNFLYQCKEITKIGDIYSNTDILYKFQRVFLFGEESIENQ